MNARDNRLVHEASTWGDMQLDVWFLNSDDDTFGVVFRLAGRDDFYLFHASHQNMPGMGNCSVHEVAGESRLYRVRKGGVSNTVDMLGSKRVTYPRARASRFRVRAHGARLQGWVDADGDGELAEGEKVFDLEDDTHARGHIGIFAYDNGSTEGSCQNGAACYFSKVVVSELRPDGDGDDVENDADNCPATSNSDQLDTDGDGVGDACDPCPADSPDDPDADGVCQSADNCPDVPNTDQQDSDGDGVGGDCDACPEDGDNDVDGDGVCGDVDNCPAVANPDQLDSDGDEAGDACDDHDDDDSGSTSKDGVSTEDEGAAEGDLLDPGASGSDQAGSDPTGSGTTGDEVPASSDAPAGARYGETTALTLGDLPPTGTPRPSVPKSGAASRSAGGCAPGLPAAPWVLCFLLLALTTRRKPGE